MALDYQRLIQDALRGVVRQALEDGVENGFEGEHHFYIAFRTEHPEVEMSPALRDLYPEGMTIVIQHQYWDLAVDEDSFDVTLAFGGKKERLVVPFAAIETFADPSAEFGLKLASGTIPGAETEVPSEAAPDDDTEPAEKDGEGLPDGVVRLDDFRNKGE